MSEALGISERRHAIRSGWTERPGWLHSPPAAPCPRVKKRTLPASGWAQSPTLVIGPLWGTRAAGHQGTLLVPRGTPLFCTTSLARLVGMTGWIMRKPERELHRVSLSKFATVLPLCQDRSILRVQGPARVAAGPVLGPGQGEPPGDRHGHGDQSARGGLVKLLAPGHRLVL